MTRRPAQKRLLNQTLIPYTVYALLTLLISIPVYYRQIDRIWLRDVDETLYFNRNKIQDRLNIFNLSDADWQSQVTLINQWGIGIELRLQEPGPEKDSLYTVIRYDPYHQHEEPFRILSTRVRVRGQDFHLRLEADLEETEDVILPIVGTAAFFMGLLLLGFILISRWLSRRIWQPFYATLDQLRQFDLNQREALYLAPTDTYEFAQLNQNLMLLMERIRAIYDQQKEFTENASHELQTPLALLQSKIDLLFQSADLSHQQAELLESAKQMIGRMNRLNRSLLLLSKIENRQFKEVSVLDFSVLMDKSLQQYADHLEGRQIQLSVQVCPDVRLEANEQLAEILVSNLLSNAIRHNLPGGALRVWLHARSLVISNLGKNQPLDETKLFRRFQKQDDSTTGMGLGLAIVQQITHRYRWQVSYCFENNEHTFTLHF